jgi:tRNA nucleotidyltransferase/poly(A) polymerase
VNKVLQFVAENESAQRQLALEVVNQLRSAGHEALWAGGCVRDQLLGIAPKDYDVATSAQPEQVRELFGHRRTLAIGAAFGVITVLGKRPLAPIDVATFRTDGDYHDGRRPESVLFTDARHDAQRRDFTINGLFFDPIAEQVVDYVGGVADLEARIVRAIGDPLRRFTEDRLRMLRAVRFAATYDFALEPATLRAIQTMADQVAKVSSERIAAELRRMLLHASRSRGLTLLEESTLLAAILPELAPHAAANDARWKAAHGRLQRLDAPTFPLALAGALQGMVEPAEAQQLGRRLRLSNKEIDRTVWLMKHLPNIHEAEKLPWPRLQRLLSHEGSGELLALAEAALPVDDPGLTRCRVQMARPAEEWNPPPLVTGDDLLAHGLRSGKHFSALLEHLRDQQLDGTLHNREEALAAAVKWINEHPSQQR